MRGNLASLQQKIGYQFQNLQLLEAALTHRSHGPFNNERLEFLGDSILNFLIADALYHVSHKASEGDLSRYRASLVCEDMLAEIALEFHLSDYLQLGIGELKSGGFRRKSILADAVEAIIAAIYLDADILACKQVVMRWFAKRVNYATTMKVKKDAKSSLQEYLQARKAAVPVYQIIEITGEAHCQTFKVNCSVEGFSLQTEGTGASRKHAEQAAAEAFLHKLTASNPS